MKRVGDKVRVFRDIGDHFDGYGHYIPVNKRAGLPGVVKKVLDPACGASYIVQVGVHELLIREKELVNRCQMDQ